MATGPDIIEVYKEGPESIYTAVMLVGVSDLIFVRVLDLAAWVFQSREKLSHNAQLNVLISLTRLIGIAGLALSPSACHSCGLVRRLPLLGPLSLL